MLRAVVIAGMMPFVSALHFQTPSRTLHRAGVKATATQEVVAPSYPASYDKEGLLSIARGEVFGKENARLPLPPARASPPLS